MDEPFESYPGYQVPPAYGHSPEQHKPTTTKATPVYKEWWFWLIIIVIGVVILIGIGIGIYFLVKEFTKSNYQIPYNTNPKVNTSLANGNNTSSTPLDGQSSYVTSTGTCNIATNANAIGWKLINNSGITLTIYIGNTRPNNTTCVGSPGFWGGAIFINPNTTKNWYDTPNNTSSGNTYYLTFYPSCSFLVSAVGPISGTGQNLPSTLNIQNQYVEITVNNSGSSGFTSTFKVVNI